MKAEAEQLLNERNDDGSRKHTQTSLAHDLGYKQGTMSKVFRGVPTSRAVADAFLFFLKTDEKSLLAKHGETAPAPPDPNKRYPNRYRAIMAQAWLTGDSIDSIEALTPKGLKHKGDLTPRQWLDLIVTRASAAEFQEIED